MILFLSPAKNLANKNTSVEKIRSKMEKSNLIFTKERKNIAKVKPNTKV
jgi:hypothetical protein